MEISLTKTVEIKKQKTNTGKNKHKKAGSQIRTKQTKLLFSNNSQATQGGIREKNSKCKHGSNHRQCVKILTHKSVNVGVYKVIEITIHLKHKHSTEML